MLIMKNIKNLIGDINNSRAEICISIVPVVVVCFVMGNHLDAYLARLNFYLCVSITRDSLLNGDMKSWEAIGWIKTLCTTMFLFTYTNLIIRKLRMNFKKLDLIMCFSGMLNIFVMYLLVNGVVNIYFHKVIFHI